MDRYTAHRRLTWLAPVPGKPQRDLRRAVVGVDGLRGAQESLQQMGQAAVREDVHKGRMAGEYLAARLVHALDAELAIALAEGGQRISCFP